MGVGLGAIDSVLGAAELDREGETGVGVSVGRVSLFVLGVGLQLATRKASAKKSPDKRRTVITPEACGSCEQ